MGIRKSAQLRLGTPPPSYSETKSEYLNYAQQFRFSEENISCVADITAILIEIAPGNNELRLAVMEAVANCLRHSHGANLGIRIERIENLYHATITDDGDGFAFEDILARARSGDIPDLEETHGRGIYLMDRLSEGTLRISDGGRRVEFFIPAVPEN
jgi:anti-sigma regulatory factor (Ser/Thr protein kinase)